VKENSIHLNTVKVQIAFYTRSAEEEEKISKKMKLKEDEVNKYFDNLVEVRKQVQAGKIGACLLLFILIIFFYV
jgi:hypothetical protein